MFGQQMVGYKMVSYKIMVSKREGALQDRVLQNDGYDLVASNSGSV